MGGVNTLEVKSGNKSTGHIIGDIVTLAGATNVKITDTNTTGAATPAIVGNLHTQSGQTNIILENALWAPHNLAQPKANTAQDKLVLQKYINTYGSGEIKTSGGRTTVVSRLSADLVGDMDNQHPLDFKVNALGGETNIVMQINSTIGLNTRAIINYTSGATTHLVFAHSNDSATGSVIGGTQRSRVASSESFENDQTNAAQNKFLGLTYQDGVKFKLQSRNVAFGNESVNLIDRYGSQYADADGNILTITSKRTNAEDTAIVRGLAIGEITSLSAVSQNNKKYVNTLQKGSAFVGSIALSSDSTATLEMQANTKLILAGKQSNIKTLTLSGDQTTINYNESTRSTLGQRNNRIIDLATNGGGIGAIQSREEFRLLEIGNNGGAGTTGLQGKDNESIIFVNYIHPNANQAKVTLGNGTKNQYGKVYADRILIHNASLDATSGASQARESIYMQFAVDANTALGQIKYSDAVDNKNQGGTAIEGNIAVLTVKNDSTTQKAPINLKTLDALQGFDIIRGTVAGKQTDEAGKTNATNTTDNYTTYFVTSLTIIGIDTSIQKLIASIFATNLDIYTANFNSLNKRMGELRDNPHSQGAWIRIFNGQQTNDFGLGSKTKYTTFQGGYDYDFGLNASNSYLGTAISYSMASSKTSTIQNTLNQVAEGVDGEIRSDMVEVALYNSYVQDEGIYYDVITKFSYIMNKFSMLGTALGSNIDTTNTAFSVSDEFGYRFKLGEEKEWHIDPQVETSFAYISGSEYTLSSGRSTLLSKADSLTQFRARLGSSFGYNFKRFTHEQPIQANLYLELFYEHDVISGGEIVTTTNLGGVNHIASALQTDNRMIVNVGTNLEIYDNTRIYFDFESSFAGKIKTDYQVILGARYSFGTNDKYTPMPQVTDNKTPLKVE